MKGKRYPASSPDGDDCDLQHTFWQRARQKVKPHRSTGQRGNAGSCPRQNINKAQPPGPVTALSQSSPTEIGNAPAQTGRRHGGHAAGPNPPLTFSRAPNPAAEPHAHPVRPTQPIQRPHNYGLSAHPGGGGSHSQPDKRDYQGHSHESVLSPFKREPQNPRNLPFLPQSNHTGLLFCQLCHGTSNTAVTCGSREADCYRCHQKGHLARACTL